MDAYSKTPLKVLMFPWLAYGHISPFLVLAKLLADEGTFEIFLCSTPINLKSIENKIADSKYVQSIHLLEFRLESTIEFPSHFHTTNGLPPHLQPTLRKAVHKARPNLSKIFDEIKPDLLIYDIILSWAVGISIRNNVPAVKFTTSGAALLAYFLHSFQKPGIPFPFKEMYLTDFEVSRSQDNFESAKKDHEEELEADGLDLEVINRPCDEILLLKSSNEIEGKYMDYLSDFLGWKCVPFCPILIKQNHSNDQEENEEHELITWLGTKNEKSSVFVSFGSEYYLNREETEEIAYALEISQVNFIWVLRFPKGEKNGKNSIDNVLPEGFVTRIGLGDKGKIITGWAPQPEILRHSSIGGFVSHCGWNSMFEAIENGVPIIAMPMHLDQPFNARLVVEIGAGIEVKRRDGGELDREEIAGMIKEVVAGGTAGDEVRKKIQSIRHKIKAREHEDLDGLVEKLKMLCNSDN